MVDHTAVDDVEPEETEGFTSRLWHGVVRAVDGIKTISVAGAMGLVGLVDELGGVDLLQTFKSQHEDNPRIGRIIIGIITVFVILRFMTTSSMFGAKSGEPKSTDDGDTV